MNVVKGFDKGKLDFVGKAPIFVAISLLAILVSAGLFLTKGFKLGIDFAGGTEVQVFFNENVNTGAVRKFTEDLGLKDASVQSIGEEKEYVIRMPTIAAKTEKESNQLLNDTLKKITDGITGTFQSQGATIRRIDTVGPQVGGDITRGGLLAAFYCLLIILIYVGIRFDFVYAQAAVLCLFHDVIVTMGIMSLVDHEMTVQAMAALLTLIGYSLNDTIVMFDRIRENVAQVRNVKITDIVNLSMNQVWSRSLKTSVTTFLSIVAMYFFTEGAIKDFSFVIGIGIIIGTYSSIYVASPLMIVGHRLMTKPA